MPIPRRLWDSNLILAYLSGNITIEKDCNLIINQAEHGEIEIVVSAMAEAEVAFLQGYSDTDSEAKILEFFSRDYIIPIAFDTKVAEEARRLIRKYRPGFKPYDAVHMASAILWHIPMLETTDPDLLKLSKKEGNPLLIIRKPLYEGTIPLPEISPKAPPDF